MDGYGKRTGADAAGLYCNFSLGGVLGNTIKQSPSIVIFLVSAIVWLILGVSNLNLEFETTQILAVGLFICGVVIAVEEIFQTKTITGNGIFPLLISLAMILNPVSEYGLVFIIGLFFPLVFLIGKSKGGAFGRRVFAVSIVLFFFATLFMLSDVIKDSERIAVFALGAVILSFVPFAVRIQTIDQSESAWKGLVLHQAMLRMSVILLGPAIVPNGNIFGLQNIVFWVTTIFIAILLANTWLRRQQRIWDCTFQIILSLLVINFASIGSPAALDWMAGATLVSLVMSMVPTQRPSPAYGLFSQLMVASENGSLGGAVSLFSMGALVASQTVSRPEMAIAQVFIIVLVGLTGWIFVPEIDEDSTSADPRVTPKIVFQILCILGALAMAGYKYVDAVAGRINV
jgi:hypothetical protein